MQEHAPPDRSSAGLLDLLAAVSFATLAPSLGGIRFRFSPTERRGLTFRRPAKLFIAALQPFDPPKKLLDHSIAICELSLKLRNTSPVLLVFGQITPV